MARTVADQIADLQAFLDSTPPAPRPRHPQAGCPCTSCSLRDERLEDIAESRAEQARGF